jgi:3-oxoacyl-[acyl-carrier protein] reductase
MVTGGSRHLGKAIAIELARRGASVAIGWSSDEATAMSTLEEVRRHTSRASAVKLDLGDTESFPAVVRNVVEELGPLEILVHSAAIRPHSSVGQLSVREWDEVHEINVRGPFFLSQAALPCMESLGGGRIIFIGGLDAYWSGIDRAHVVASKLGVVGVARALASELAERNITVNTVVPGPLESARGRLSDSEYAAWIDRIPLRRFGTFSEVAAASVFLISQEASYITGQELFLTGGAMPLVGGTRPAMEGESMRGTDEATGVGLE